MLNACIAKFDVIENIEKKLDFGVRPESLRLSQVNFTAEADAFQLYMQLFLGLV